MITTIPDSTHPSYEWQCMVCKQVLEGGDEVAGERCACGGRRLRFVTETAEGVRPYQGPDDLRAPGKTDPGGPPPPAPLPGPLSRT
jgi:predicted  nucleic acid-binding Zn-ribbon protein